jgi:hypothetical protein
MKFFKVRILRGTTVNCELVSAGAVVDETAHDALSLLAASSGSRQFGRMHTAPFLSRGVRSCFP